MRVYIAGLLAVALLCVSGVANAIVYNINYSAGGNPFGSSLSGTITTDGALGPLAAGDITAWTLTGNADPVLDGTRAFTIGSDFNAAQVVCPPLPIGCFQASLTSLVYDFSAQPLVYFFALQELNPYPTQVRFESDAVDPGRSGVEMLEFTAIGSFAGEIALSPSRQVIAIVIPEPSSVLLLCFGLVGLRFRS